MHDLGPASFILGLEIKQDCKKRKITLFFFFNIYILLRGKPHGRVNYNVSS
jgi:hypothetical protein